MFKISFAFIIVLFSFGCSNSGADKSVSKDSVAAQTEDEAMQPETNDYITEVKVVDAFEAGPPMPKECESPFKMQFNQFSVNSERSLVTYFFEAYSSEEKYNKYKNSSTNGSVLSPYGQGDFDSKKAAITEIYNKINRVTRQELDYEEKYSLSNSFISDNNARARVEGWKNCVALNAGQPYLSLDEFSKTDVLLTLDMVPNRQNTRKAKVVDIQYSSNLTLNSSEVKKNANLDYGTPYPISFTRNKDGEAWVTVSLANVAPLKVYIPKAAGPDYKIEWKKDVLSAKAKFNVSANWLTVSGINGADAPQKITFPNQPGPKYKLNLEIKTNLKNPDAKITDAFYTALTGGVSDQKFNGYKVAPDGTLVLLFYIRTFKKSMTGKFNILYEKQELECIANCD